MLLFSIILILIGVALFVYAVTNEVKSKYDFIVMPASIGTAITIFGVALLPTGENKPTAIDVYNNKTTLQITYQDSIPVDTIVVWKDEFKPNK